MLTTQDNDLVTRIGPGTTMGQALRRYWLPALLSRELPEPDCAPVRVRLAGENLVAFRDSSGQVGLLDEHCPHRGASLFFGRNEECGLRCVYHGWKFDRAGNCVDMPNEPPESNFKDKIHHTAYPVEERSGVVWAYLGPVEKQPPMADYEWLRLPKGHSYVSKTFEECNYLQAIEGGVDSSHSSFLHRRMAEGGYGAATRTQGMRARSTAPRLEVLNTDYGYMYASVRHLPDDQQNYVRVYHFVMPFQQLRAFEGIMPNRPVVQGHMWVPIDDEHTWVYNIYYACDGSELSEEEILEEETMTGRGPNDLLPNFHLKRNKSNDYLIDRELQKTGNYPGIEGVNTQDMAVQESMGPIYDRTREHLGTADLAVIATRRLLIEAAKSIQRGEDPLGADGGSSGHVRPAESVLPEQAPWHEAMSGLLATRW